MGDEGTEGNVSSSTLQRINKISGEGLNIRFLLIREEKSAHKFGEDMAVNIFCVVHNEVTDRSSCSTTDRHQKGSRSWKPIQNVNSKFQIFSEFYFNPCTLKAASLPRLTIT